MIGAMTFAVLNVMMCNAKNEDAMMTETFSLNLSTEQETLRLAQALAQTVSAGLVFLIGDLGAGKTTLTRYWLQSLGHQGAVKSPTYTLVEPYQIGDKAIFHFDLYRLQDPYELELMGIRDYLEQSHSLSLVEWPSKGEGILPDADLCIDIVAEDELRHVTLTGSAQFIQSFTQVWSASA